MKTLADMKDTIAYTIRGSNKDESLKLIYQWVKTGVIGFNEFKELIEYNTEFVIIDHNESFW